MRSKTVKNCLTAIRKRLKRGELTEGTANAIGYLVSTGLASRKLAYGFNPTKKG